METHRVRRFVSLSLCDGDKRRALRAQRAPGSLINTNESLSDAFTRIISRLTATAMGDPIIPIAESPSALDALGRILHLNTRQDSGTLFRPGVSTEQLGRFLRPYTSLICGR